MWNMNFTLPCLIILVIIIFAYLTRKRLPLRINHFFIGLLLVAFLTVMADYFSTYMDNYGQRYSNELLWVVNFVFFVLFILRSFYLFWLPVLLYGIQHLEKFFHITIGINVCEYIFLLIGSLNGWIFSIQNHAYVSGPLYEFINLQFGLWIIVDLVLILQKHHSNYIRKTGIYLYIVILLTGILIRYLVPHMVVMNMFSLFAIMTVYLIYLNPDQYFDDLTGLFNEWGWSKVINEAPTRKNFCFVGFAICNFSALRETRDTKTLSNALKSIGEWISHTWPKLATYYAGNGIYIISSEKKFDQQKVLDEITWRFSQPWSADSGDYYLSVNKMVMKPWGEQMENKRNLIGCIREAYLMISVQEQRDLVHIDETLIHKHLRKLHVQKVLSDALTNEKLEMFLQPIVNTTNGEVDGAEALCRLKDESGQYIFPDEFIPIASKNGNMGLLGEQMFEKACALISREDVRFSNLKWISVNVVPDQFRNPNLLHDFLGILNKYHLDASVVHLEITEEKMIDRHLLHDCLDEFSKYGFIISMDDFGSSYSNMIRLQQNRFSDVKIDRDFVWSYFKQPDALLPDIISTCHDLGMRVICEGIETQKMVEGIKAIDADYIQGYYYSKPIPAEEFISQFIQKNN